MTRPQLRVAKPGEPQTSIEMPEAIEAVMRECIADQPQIVFMIWEVPSEKDKDIPEVKCRSVPNSYAARRGLTDMLYQEFFGPSKDSDD